MTGYPPDHGTRHGLQGSDPGEIGVAPASLMGSVIGTGVFPSALSTGFNFYGGTMYLPDNDIEPLGLTPPLKSGDDILVTYSHYAPIGFFDWMAVRVHAVTGLKADNYAYGHPWESDPWNGGIGAPASTDPYPFNGGWHGLVCFSAVTNISGETVTWTLPDVGATAEDHGFDDIQTGGGHIGYLFHDFGSSRVVGDVTVSYSGGSTEHAGAIQWVNLSNTFVLGDMVGETIFDGIALGQVTDRLTVTLTEDIPAGTQLVIVTGTKGPLGFVPPDAGTRPQVIVKPPSGLLVPKFKLNGRRYGLPEFPLSGAATGASGDAGGDLDGSYPDPTVVALEETGGPTRLTLAAIPDGDFLKRSGTTIIGATAGGSSPLTTKGDLYTHSTVDARLAVGSNDQILIADSSQTDGLRWGGIDGGSA